MTNLFAWRDTSPTNMRKADAPVGADNDYWLIQVAQGASMILAAWGNEGGHLSRSEYVRSHILTGDLKCLAINKVSGEPKHPLYCRSDSKPLPFKP